MSHPLLKDAIEAEFVPLAIYNNQPGQDAKLLKHFGEPSWNYQVVRFLDHDGKDILPRKDRVWTLEGIAQRMVESLEKAKRPSPAYLRSLTPPQGRVETVAFSMFCFWTGEVELGKLPGVLETEAGWLDGHEVTKVRYDSHRLPFSELLKSALKVDCARKVYSNDENHRELAAKTSRLSSGTLKGYRPAKASDQKRQLSGTPFAQLDLNPQQATKVNALARRNLQEALPWLSPSQLKKLQDGN